MVPSSPERSARDNRKSGSRKSQAFRLETWDLRLFYPWIESLWGRFKGENGSLLSEAAILEEPEWALTCLLPASSLLYDNSERRRSGLDYRASGEYLAAQGIRPRVLIVIGPPRGSVSGAQVHARAKTGLWRLWYKTAAAQRVGVPNA